MMKAAAGEHRAEGQTGSAARFGRNLPPPLLLFLAILFPAPPAHSAELVLDEASGHIVEVMLNGVPLRLKVELDHSYSVTLNPAAAARAGMGRGKGRAIEIIGPVRLEGRFADAPLFIAGRKIRAKVTWQDRPAVSGADGTITPHLLPFEKVVLQRRPQPGAERDIVYSSRLHENHGIHVPVRIGRHSVAVRMSLVRATTIAPTAAAAVIASTHGGILGERSSLEEIAFGIKRPARLLRLEHPLQVGSLAVPSLMARTADFRGDHELMRTRPEVLEGEILVTARSPSQPPLYRMTVGLDVLGRCSSATYTRGTGELRLRCAAGPSL